MKIALVAHNNKKNEIVNLVSQYCLTFKNQEIYSTQHTGEQIKELGFDNVHTLESGPFGGDIEIANMVLKNQLDILIFLIDPLISHPHECDIRALVRASNVNNLILATNDATARVILDSLKRNR